ncbi:MAG: fibronectin type III domain-containing protein, partial [Acidimicrobiales bacterium]
VSFSADSAWVAGTGDAYTVTSSPGGFTCSVANATTTLAGSQSCVVTGLTTGTSYTFVVSETGSSVALTSSASLPSNAVVAGAVLSTPVALVLSATSAKVSFSADSAWTYVAGNLYTVVASGTAGQACTVGEPDPASSATLSCTVSGLVVGDTYTFRVSETGTSPTSLTSLSSNAVRSLAPLATPIATVLNSTSASVTFSADSAWAAGSGDAYTVTSSPGGLTCSVANATTTLTGSQSCVVSGLTTGTSYTFVVSETGTTILATSGPSLSSNAVTLGSALATPTVTWAASGAALVSFSADGVATTYSVRAATAQSPYSAVGACVVSNTTAIARGNLSCTVTGLTNGVAYTFTVTPSGNATTSLPSLPSAPFTPSTTAAPSAPTALHATGGVELIVVHWAAPLSVGGTPITSYQVTATAGASTLNCGALSATATTCTLRGLKPATTYSVSVIAINAVGSSVAATSTATTSATVLGPFARGSRGFALVGRTVTITIVGGRFYGQPIITSTEVGTRVGVVRDTGVLLTIRVTTAPRRPTGERTFTLRFADGKTCKVNYAVR